MKRSDPHSDEKDAHQVRITDRNSGESLGTVATINSDGFVVSLERRVEQGTVLQLSLELTAAPQDVPLDLGAVSLWSSKGGVDNSYWVAFQIIDISQAAQRQLESMLDQLRSLPPAGE